MADYQIDATGEDLLIEAGDLVLTPSRAAAAAQRLQIGLGIFLREWALDLTEGLPYREEIRVKGVRLDLVRARFLARILRDPDVAQVLELTLTLNRVTRGLDVSFRALVLDNVPGLDGASSVVVGSGAVAQGVPELLCLVEPFGGYL